MFKDQFPRTGSSVSELSGLKRRKSGKLSGHTFAEKLRNVWKTRRHAFFTGNGLCGYEVIQHFQVSGAAQAEYSGRFFVLFGTVISVYVMHPALIDSQT